jgi:hypothetical protein
MESGPQLFSNEDQSVVMTAIWNTELDEEGHTKLAVVLDPIAKTLTAVESEGHSYPLYGKYTLSGIAASNGLSFDVVVSDECVSCSVGEDVDNRLASSDDETTSSNPILH